MDNPGIYRDKTMADKLMYIPNDDTKLPEEREGTLGCLFITLL